MLWGCTVLLWPAIILHITSLNISDIFLGKQRRNQPNYKLDHTDILIPHFQCFPYKHTTTAHSDVWSGQQNLLQSLLELGIGWYEGWKEISHWTIIVWVIWVSRRDKTVLKLKYLLKYNGGKRNWLQVSRQWVGQRKISKCKYNSICAYNKKKLSHFFFTF